MGPMGTIPMRGAVGLYFALASPTNLMMPESVPPVMNMAFIARVFSIMPVLRVVVSISQRDRAIGENTEGDTHTQTCSAKD